MNHIRIFCLYITPVQLLQCACHSEFLDFKSYISNDTRKSEVNDICHQPSPDGNYVHLENSSSFSKFGPHPLRFRDSKTYAGSLSGDIAVFKYPVVKKMSGLSNLLQGISTSSFTKMGGEEKPLPLVVELLKFVSEEYLSGCMSIVLYDKEYEGRGEMMLRSLLLHYSYPMIHGVVSREDAALSAAVADPRGGQCRHYILLLQDLWLVDLVGNQSISRVVVVTEAPSHHVRLFLSEGPSHGIVNLLLVGWGDRRNTQPTLVLSTHELFLGRADAGRVLTTWRRGGLTRNVHLFPDKLRLGFNGQRFVVASSDQPHYVIHRNVSGSDSSEGTWDGLEVRLLRLLAQTLNFSVAFQNFPATDRRSGQASGVVDELVAGRAHIGLAGFYVSTATLGLLTLSASHSIDCATFITRASTALPRYRAIMGPFHWSVWLLLTLTYLLAIFPVAFSHRHSLRSLLMNPWRIETMFWYVFGTFTNCFTFGGKDSWTSADKNATRMFIGTYWMFSIIVTACYTGSIISFVTLPVYPRFLDSVRQIHAGGFKVAMLDGEGWQHYFNDSSDPVATKVLQKAEYLAALEDGLRNLTKRRNSHYAVFGSRDKLDFILRSNFTHGDTRSRAFLHIADECFVPFHVAVGFPRHSPHSDAMNRAIIRAVQSGLVLKLRREVDWLMRRSSTGRFLQVSSGAERVHTKPPDRMLSLDDVQGNFLLLGAGFAIAFFSLFMEVIVSFVNKKYTKYCQRKLRSMPNARIDNPFTDEIYSQEIPEHLGTR